MSHHRKITRETVDAFAMILRPVFTLEVLQKLASSAEKEFRFNVLTGESSSRCLILAEPVRTRLSASAKKIEQLREAFIEMRVIRTKTTVHPCVTAAADAAAQLTGVL